MYMSILAASMYGYWALPLVLTVRRDPDAALSSSADRLGLDALLRDIGAARAGAAGGVREVAETSRELADDDRGAEEVRALSHGRAHLAA